MIRAQSTVTPRTCSAATAVISASSSGSAALQGRHDRRVGRRGEHRVGPDLQEDRPGVPGQRVVEPDGVPDVVHPVVGVPAALEGDDRLVEGEAHDSPAEVVEHRVHQAGVEGVRDVAAA